MSFDMTFVASCINYCSTFLHAKTISLQQRHKRNKLAAASAVEVVTVSALA